MVCHQHSPVKYQVNLNFNVASLEESIQKFRGLCCLPAVARLSAVLTKKTGSLSLLICHEGFSPQPRPLCVVGRLERGKKESARGTMGRGNRPARLQFFDYCYFHWYINPALAPVEERV